MRYEIIDGVLHIFDEGSDVAFIVQPTWPCGDEWAVGEAEAWAAQVILSLNDVTADLAGPSREMPTESRPIFESADEPNPSSISAE